MNAAAEIADFEAAHPGWRVSWCDEGLRYARRANAAHPSPFEHPAGYVAEHARRNVTVCGATLGELDAAIAAAPAWRHWMHRSNCCALSWGD